MFKQVTRLRQSYHGMWLSHKLRQIYPIAAHFLKKCPVFQLPVSDVHLRSEEKPASDSI